MEIEAFLTFFEEDEWKSILSGVRPPSHFLGTADLGMDERTSLKVTLFSGLWTLRGEGKKAA